MHNRIDATFVFRDGKIVRHTDRFDLRVWAAQALGLKGKLLGWLPPVQNAIRKNADAKGLRASHRQEARVSSRHRYGRRAASRRRKSRASVLVCPVPDTVASPA